MGRRIKYDDDPAAPKPNSLVPAADVLAVDDVGRVLLQRRRDTGQRKATLLVDAARAYLQRERHERAFLALRSAHQTAPEEVAERPSVRALVRTLADTAPVTVRRDAAHFAASIGVVA